jgi:hypothetical protein
MQFQLTINFPSGPSGPGPNISLAVDAPDVESALELAKPKVRAWVLDQARALTAALGNVPAADLAPPAP